MLLSAQARCQLLSDSEAPRDSESEVGVQHTMYRSSALWLTL